MTTASAPPAPQAVRPRPFPRVAAAVLGLTAAVVLMLLAFVAPAVGSGAHDLPIAVSGPAPVVDRLTSALESKQPGAFAVTRVGSADEVTQQVRDRDAVGGIAVGPAGAEVVTASAAGTPYAPILKAVGAGLQAQGQHVTYVDAAPLTSDDPNGAGLTGLGLPLAFGGMASAAVLSSLVKGGTPGSRAAWRTGGAIAFSVLAGLAATAVLRFGVGTLAGDYLTSAGVFALGVAAVSLTVLGLESLFGMPGLGIGAILMMFVANPLSGMATGAAWLPRPWGTLGQLLPIGAAGTAIRSASFFDGHGMATPMIVLAAWVVIGLVLAGLSVAKGRRGAASAA